MSDESKRSRRPRGRPKGAKNLIEPIGARRAREYFELKDAGERPSRAADKVAEGHGVATEAIFNAARRHESRLAAEILQEAERIHHELRDKAAGLVRMVDVESAQSEAIGIIDACADRRLRSEWLSKALAGMTAEERKSFLLGVVFDLRLEIAQRLAERANGMPPTVTGDDGEFHYANGGRLLFEKMAEAFKPDLK